MVEILVLKFVTLNTWNILLSELANFSQLWSKICHPWDQCKSSEKMSSYMGVWVVLPAQDTKNGMAIAIILIISNAIIAIAFTSSTPYNPLDT